MGLFVGFEWPWDENKKVHQPEPEPVPVAREFYIPREMTIEVAQRMDAIDAGTNKMEHELLLWQGLEVLFPDLATGKWFIERRGARLVVKERLPQKPPPMCFG